jgi:hypothetical protein
MKRFVILTCGIGIILVSIWGVSAVVTKNSGGGGGNPEGRAQDIKAKIVELDISDPQSIETEGTPQYLAIQWLANVDKTNLRDPFLMHRYVLAVLYYSTAGTTDHVEPRGNWKDQTSWMTSSGYCSWYGIKCETSPDGPVFDGHGEVTTLNLTSNALIGTLPDELVALSGLMRLDLSSNGLTGTLPSSLSDMQHLSFLILSENELQGTLPSDYGLKLSTLRQLQLSSNKLDGTLPRQLQHMENLKGLSLSHNQFSGPIPDLEDLDKLMYLYLESNNLSGPFPDSVTKLTALVDLKLSNNHLTGFLPQDLDKLTKLGKHNFGIIFLFCFVCFVLFCFVLFCLFLSLIYCRCFYCRKIEPSRMQLAWDHS